MQLLNPEERQKFIENSIQELVDVKIYPEDIELCEFLTEPEKMYIFDKFKNKVGFLDSIQSKKDDQFLDYLHKNPINIRGDILTWGTDKLDEKITPIQPNHYVVFAGETGSGKTAFCAYMAEENAKKYPVMFLSMEMSGVGVINRMAREYAGITKKQWRDKSTITQDQKEKYQSRRSDLYNNENLMFGDVEHRTIDCILDSIKSSKPSLAIIDNFGFIENDQNTGSTEFESYVSRELVNFTNTENIPVILLHHYKKGAGDEKKEKRGLNALRGSAKFSHDPDTVVMCHRPDESDEFIVYQAKDRDFGDSVKKTITTVYFDSGKFSDFRKSDPPATLDDFTIF